MIWDILEESSFNDYFSPSSILTLTPQKLLLDQNIITEFKNLNPKLIEFVQSDYNEFMGRLIQYTIKLPSETDSQDRIRKLPYVSSEVLAIDNQTIYKAFFTEPKDYFAELLGLFSSEAKDNEILSGYFVKILQNLYKCQKKQTAKKIYAFREVFFNNLDKQSVSTVFSNFLVLLQTQEGFMLNQRKQVIHKLIQQLQTENQSVKSTCKNVLVEVISKFQTFSSGDQLLAQILKSEILVKVFSIQNSQAVDEFLIGYMTKALQKICTSGEEKKSLFQMPQSHKDGIKTYINLKKHILQSEQSPKNGFKNQSRTQVFRLDKNITKILNIMKLALQNSITGFLNEQDFIALFTILEAHPSNDIIKVKIFDIFALIYTKKDFQAQQVFGKYFFSKAIHFFTKDKKMYGHFLRQLWKIINKKITVQPPLHTEESEKWTQLLKYFELLENYEKQAQKVVDRYSNLTKVTKLVVDEEDNPSNPPVVSRKAEESQQNSHQFKSNPLQSPQKFVQEKVKHIQKTQNQKSLSQSKSKASTVDAFSFDFFEPKTQPQKSTSSETKAKVDPFAAFDFFEPKIAKPTETKTEEKKKADFADFSSFF